MAITHETAVRDALSDQIDTLVNTGAGTAVLKLRDGTTDIISFDLPDPAFGASSSGTITLNGVPINAAASATGSVDGFQVLDKDATVIFSGTVTVTGGGGDMEMNSTSLTITQTCDLTSFTYSSSA